MIIIEGCDNTGKTTLGLRLERDMEIPVRHSIRPDPKWSQRECRDHAFRQLQPQRALLDRIYAISETVYGPICRGENALGEYAKEALLDLYCRSHLIIYCRPHMSVILKNRGRDQMAGVIENHEKLVKAYDLLMFDVARYSKCKVIQFDWKNKTEYPNLLKQCQDHIKEFDQQVWSAHFKASEGVPV